MIHELRIYRALPGQMPRLLQRFREHTLAIWQRLGIRPIGFWTTAIGDADADLTYLLAWESFGDRETRWRAFQMDATWQQVKADSEKPGYLVAYIHNQLLVPTDFSNIR